MRQEQAAVLNEWQKMAATMQNTRNKAAAETSSRPAKAARATPRPPLQTGKHQETPELVALCNRVFRHLASRLDGARLVEMEKDLGASRFQMIRSLRLLMDEHKVEKRDLLYFAT